MDTPLRLLILEDQESDAELLLYELRRAGFDPDWRRVESETDYRDHLDAALDIILADYTLPQFDAQQALHLLRKRDLDIPFIVVTGSIGEEQAVACIKQGAADYLLKDRLARLGTAVTQALEEKQLRQARRQAEDELQRYAVELEQRVLERTVELRQEKERVEAILNNSSDAIILANIDGNIQQVNPAFVRLFGHTLDYSLGNSLLTLAQSDFVERLLKALHEVVNTFGSVRTEITCIRQDGTVFEADIALAAMVENRQIQGVVCSLHDITDRKRAEHELRRALEREKELNELKSRFVSTVSHEFRTPLAVILASSALLKQFHQQIAEARRLEYLDQIQTKVHQLIVLLDTVLNFGKAETLGVEFAPEPVDLEALCLQFVSEVQLTTENHIVSFESSGVCSPIMLDVKLLRQTIVNLLSNAIKYSPDSGSVQITLVCADDQVTITVQDHGIGIPQDDQERLFDLFHRAGNVGSISGTGLGMAIVKQAVEAHSGLITFESQVDVGTTFTITLPVLHKA
jgi:PAS domain S-box-containing protein